MVPFRLSKLNGWLVLLSGLVIITFSNLPRSEWPKYVTVMGVVHLFWLLTFSSLFCDDFEDCSCELTVDTLDEVVVGPVTDSVSLSPPCFVEKR